MEDRVLIAYASRCGSTAEVAEAIGQVLREAGAVVDVRPVKDVHDLGPYRGVMIGSAVRMGKLLPEALRFAKGHQDDLRRMKATAYFVVCATIIEDTPQNREQAATFPRPLCEIRQPVSVGLFAGRVDPSKMEFPWNLMCRLFMKGTMAPGDGRDWDAIRAWAGDVRGLMVS